MGSFLRLVNGQQRSFQESASQTIYDQLLTVVAGTAANSNQVQGPITAGVAIALPNSRTYTGLELQIVLNGVTQENVFDWNFSGGGAPYSAVSFTYQILVGDTITFRILRAT